MIEINASAAYQWGWDNYHSEAPNPFVYPELAEAYRQGQAEREEARFIDFLCQLSPQLVLTRRPQ